MKNNALKSIACAALLILPTVGMAQSYPKGSIDFIVPFSAGGGTDFASRVLTEKLSEQQGWNFVIENRGGAGGNIGLSQLARAKNDGQVMGMGQTSNMAINPTLYASIPYDSLNDFTPIALVSSQPMVLAVNQNSAYEDFESLVAAARENPGKVSMSTPGSGTVSHLSMEVFSDQADVEFMHVPYPGAAQAVTDAIGGHVDFVTASLPSLLSHIRSGSLKALAVTSLERNAALPDVPSIAELGYEGFKASDWKAVVGPAGLPDDVVATFNAAINQALQDERLIETIENEGSTVEGGSADEFAAYLQAEYERWAEAVSASGATVE
ncbi:Tricarboxylate transport protein TctC [Halomonas citrativorans]|uniref:Tricarboxylate transport protein TctC n=1 Tax=Halomonas citrativorans TaxID=2742612 RepID=A0A1R4HYP3_9GAMM|nr:tripartite tricarboxylate transporter substrate binding protein [Halomonas citrativorans]MBE0402476.1 tripartite tricarboxylate transporter substrate binding protein [Halomonas citrativorans]SJN12596.1 Tricarboxylate transport protein TctC [Halomonas citrativorans]